MMKKMLLKIIRLIKRYIKFINSEFEKDRITDYVDDFKFYRNKRYF